VPMIGSARADMLMNLVPGAGWADVATKHDVRQLEVRIDAQFHESASRVERALREQTRTLMLGLVGAMFTMTSLCLGAIALAV
jgi:hypothetical protein